MANKGNIKRIEISYFEGVNGLISDSLAKPQEFWHMENANSDTIGVIEKRYGYRRLGNALSATACYGIFDFDNTTATNSGFYRISKVSGVTNIYYLNTSATWVALTGAGAGITATRQFHTTIAEGELFLVDGVNDNMTIAADGTTVVTSATSSNHTYGSPKARQINYYKDKIYLADYTDNTTRHKNGVMFSSSPLGILSLVDGDYAVGVTTIKVTDTKYIRATDSLDVYRGGTKIQTITVSAKGEDEITVTATTNAINSSDELWVANTYGSVKKFRWADNSLEGINVKEYNTFKLSGAENSAINLIENVGNYMMIANNNNLAFWNGDSLTTLDLNIGCCSENGYVKAGGVMFFLDYKGVYATDGSMPTLMSSKVERYFQGATQAGLEAACAGRKKLSVFFSIGDVTLYYEDGSVEKTLTNVILEYNIRQKNWFVHTGINADYFNVYISSADVNRLEFADTAEVYDFLNTTAYYDDDVTSNVEIPMVLETNSISLGGSFESVCYPKQIIIEAKRGNSIKVFISTDSDPYYELRGDAKKGISIINVTGKDMSDPSPKCKKIKIKLVEYTKSKCALSRLALLYQETPEEEDFIT
jgi:hypothetical protein